MIVYAESSAILAWLLHERQEAAIRGVLAKAERIVASALTEVECARALARGAVTGRLPPAAELAARELLRSAASTWISIDMAGPILERARRAFPHEPVRTLDALHLATAAFFHEAHGGLTLLSLDDHLRTNGEALGLLVAP